MRHFYLIVLISIFYSLLTIASAITTASLHHGVVFFVAGKICVLVSSLMWWGLLSVVRYCQGNGLVPSEALMRYYDLSVRGFVVGWFVSNVFSAIYAVLDNAAPAAFVDMCFVGFLLYGVKLRIRSHG